MWILIYFILLKRSKNWHIVTKSVGLMHISMASPQCIYINMHFISALISQIPFHPTPLFRPSPLGLRRRCTLTIYQQQHSAHNADLLVVQLWVFLCLNVCVCEHTQSSKGKRKGQFHTQNENAFLLCMYMCACIERKLDRYESVWGFGFYKRCGAFACLLHHAGRTNLRQRFGLARKGV